LGFGKLNLSNLDPTVLTGYIFLLFLLKTKDLENTNMQILWDVVSLVLGTFFLQGRGKSKTNKYSCEQQQPLSERIIAHNFSFFTTGEKWMNDPNGLVYNKGI